MFTRSGLVPFLWIAAAAFLAALPMLFLGSALGHDFDFHVSIWLDAAQQFQQGILLPRWAAVSQGGFGEPVFIFYPPLSWITGGLLALALPWEYVVSAYVFLMLLLAGIAMWKLAGLWLEPPDALAAGLLYLWNPYILVVAYRRSSFSELLADALFPWLAWSVLRLFRDGGKTIFPLVAIFAAIWLSNIPEALVASYSLALLLAIGSVLRHSPRPALWGSLAIVATFACLAFFIVPDIREQPWVQIAMALHSDWLPENNFVFTSYGFNHTISLVAILLAGATAAAAALSWRLRRRLPEIWYLLAGLGAASAFLLFRASSLLWRILPELRYVQFPWRWLTPLAVAGAALAASVIAESRGKQLMRVVAVGAAGLLGAAMLLTVTWDARDLHMSALAAGARSGRGYGYPEGKDWSLPLASHPSKLPRLAPPVAPAGDAQGVRIDVEQWAPERKLFSVLSGHPTLLRIRLLNYPAWRATMNGRGAPLQTDPETGQMLLPAAAGSSEVEIVFTRTWDRTAGMIVSYASILLLALAWLYCRRRLT